MTLDEYILNPMGKKNAVLNAAAREGIRKMYKFKFDNIMLRENGKLKYHLFKKSDDNTYWAYFKIPSETVKDFYYDVVFKFYADNDVKDAGRNLFKYNIKFFSNDPAFTFTYAYVFAKNHLFVEELMRKMSTKALKTAAVEKNPNDVIGYVKIIYFAYLVMENRNLNKISKFESEAKPFDLAYLYKEIENTDDKIEERQEEGKGVSHKKKLTVDKKTGKRIQRMSKGKDTSRLQISTTKRVKKIKSATKNSKFVRTTKKK